MLEPRPPNYIGDKIRWRYIKKLLPSQKGGLLLDAGCGMCEYKELAEYKGYKYVGFDTNPASPGLRGSITDIPFSDDTFDVVICVDVLEHIKEDHKAISEIRRVLKSGGILILHVPNKHQKHILFDNPEEHDDHEREGYSPLDLSKNAGSLFYDFENVSWYETFNFLESIAWDLMHAILNKVPVTAQHIDNIIAEKEDSYWVHYGYAVVARK